MYCSHDSINGILPTLAVVFNSPDVSTVTDTPFVLQQLGFVAVESAKITNALIFKIIIIKRSSFHILQQILYNWRVTCLWRGENSALCLKECVCGRRVRSAIFFFSYGMSKLAP